MSHCLSPTRETIFLVDDEIKNIQVAGRVLVENGYEVVPCRSGAEALEKAEHIAPDLFLLDVMMPEMDGFELCEKLQEKASLEAVPKIFFTAVRDENFLTRAFQVGAVDYLTKPVSFPELLARVKSHLGLRQANRNLERLLQQRNELLSTLAHDLRNPLSALSISTEMMRELLGQDPGPHLEAILNTVEQTVADGILLLDQLTDGTSEDELQEVPVHLTSVDPVETLEHLQEKFQTLAEAKHLVFEVENRLEGPVQISADALALQRVLENLLSNALKFSDKGKAVVLLASARRGKVEFCVQDQGPGFSEEDQKRMFKRYARLSAQPTAGEASTGLGLSIVNDLVKRMEGELEFETFPDKGTRFFVRLPLA